MAVITPKSRKTGRQTASGARSGQTRRNPQPKSASTDKARLVTELSREIDLLGTVYIKLQDAQRYYAGGGGQLDERDLRVVRGIIPTILRVVQLASLSWDGVRERVAYDQQPQAFWSLSQNLRKASSLLSDLAKINPDFGQMRAIFDRQLAKLPTYQREVLALANNQDDLATQQRHPGVLSTDKLDKPAKWGDPTINTPLSQQLGTILAGTRSATWHSKSGQTFTFRRLDNGSVGMWQGNGAPPMPPLRRFTTVTAAQQWLDTQSSGR